MIEEKTHNMNYLFYMFGHNLKVVYSFGVFGHNIIYVSN